MREGLREVPEPLAAGTALLSVETEVVRVTEHLLEHEPGLLEPGGVGAPGAGEGLDQPERADVERALLAAEPVHRLPCVVPVHEAVRDEPRLRSEERRVGKEGTARWSPCRAARC